MSDIILAALLADFRRLHSAHSTQTDESPEGKAAADATYDAFWAAIEMMVKTPATSFQGLAAKAAVLGEYNNPDALDELVLSLASDCTRLGGGGAPPTATKPPLGFSVTEIWQCVVSVRAIFNGLDEESIKIDRKDCLAMARNSERQQVAFQYGEALRDIGERTPARGIMDVFAHLLLAENRADNMVESDCTPGQVDEGLHALRRIIRSSLVVISGHLNLDLAEWSGDVNTGERCAGEFVEGIAA